MENINDIKLINKRDGQILYRAMCDYRTKLWPKKGKPSKELIEVNDLTEQLKAWAFDQ